MPCHRNTRATCRKLLTPDACGALEREPVGAEGLSRSVLVRINGETVLEYDQLDNLEESNLQLQAHAPGRWTEFKQIRLKRQGYSGPTPASEPGDAIVTVQIAAHPHFRIDGHDLRLDLPVTVLEALAGAEVSAPTFEGPVRLKIPPRSQSGRKLRLRGRGLPALKGGATGAPRGDLYVVLQIVLPEDSPEARQAAAALEKLYKGDVRKDVVL